MRAGATLCVILTSLLATAIGVSENALPHTVLAVSPEEATVGDRLRAELVVLLALDEQLDSATIGPELGPFVVLEGAWSGPSSEGTRQRWTWTGSVVAFRTGRLEVPPIHVRFERADGSAGSAESAPVSVQVRSVLDSAEVVDGEIPELSDLKPPASLLPDYTGLWIGGVGLALLLALALVAWWLQRRFAATPAGIELPTDPYDRVPPHVWVYEALRELLDRRLVEQQQIETFFMELSRIVKLYLAGRYRVDLLERTSGEVPYVLEHAGTPGPTIAQTRGLLDLADQVKFAGEMPDSQKCHGAMESAYEIVEATKPREEAERVDERGAA